VRDVRRAVAKDPVYPPVLFICQGTVADGEAFFARYWPEARAVADLGQRFSRAFGIGRGAARQLFGPGVWVAGLRAVPRGNWPGRVRGDPRLMPGAFLVQGAQVLWAHAFRHAGDPPDFAAIPAVLAAARKSSASPSA
jgi:hypothetical protein